MNERYFQTLQLGMAAQLKELSLDEVVLYVLNHLHNFLLDESICMCFIDRLANDPETARHGQAQKTLLYLLDKGLQLRPLRPGLLDAVGRLTGNTQVRQRLDIVRQYNRDAETYGLISGLNLKVDAGDAAEFIARLLKAHPDHVAAAQFALAVDRQQGVPAGPWLAGFACPDPLRRDWEIALFNHQASVGALDQAMALWPDLNKAMLRETSLNLAAELFAAAGNTAQAVALYEKSLRQDPRQTPVHLRLRELQSRFAPDASLLTRRRVSICLYSWNKADMLGQTLESLSRSDIGPARIDVLLNGCTDHSREVVERARALFPDNEFTVHDLHVNIGAPAARNWLAGLPEVRASDYIAFLDDDVTVQRDWLASFLTVAEADTKVAVVGCKIVHPGSPALLQYLYRYVAIADHGLLKVSINAPEHQYDTHVYDVVRETRSVMGCQHLLRTSALADAPAGFDIRFSPSQVDDIDHDLVLCLAGHKVMYCGPVTCVHHQSSGKNETRATMKMPDLGAIMGNDIKFYYKHAGHLDRLKALDNLGLDLGVPLPEI
ncbi:MAG: glycosyltransferase [Pseudodesulfovibrio sp.]|uniref:Glycosyl transferase family 2 n=1 Tax=Pseudodesulfovibrio aespoeensis (strain ATCC 700646 / DSM 10631 / Aspo-2) TaxID=643562 RepID=E6VVS9_PSEA9|nr:MULTISPECIES: glycosyltransferase family A protein [Pseudodesulfovibrio]MBU4192960.1 glycosyltransferase [Pseudomonadota bacterium]ADU61281.1 glycosyl transferase family 2 [Pseudodesulfovibrio aespoeensis Aspo-2]MBU4243937.1 glycosyltransferase [Pseudomonadota bacterium]MBU4379326.1 glycosyltransferase [Pseudomonadota bacterium]MBU4476768.1 glycosyltransferase [Pseudomonadota bacterium]